MCNWNDLCAANCMIIIGSTGMLKCKISSQWNVHPLDIANQRQGYLPVQTSLIIQPGRPSLQEDISAF